MSAGVRHCLGNALLFYYFAKVPKLPYEVSHQHNSVRVLEYHVGEGQTVSAGQPLITVDNWWATMQLEAVTSGQVSKTFFDTGTHVTVGDPFAIIICEGDAGPGKGPTASVRIMKIIRQKPSRRSGNA